ncbi:MAG: ABC transporter substrate-binding protein [Chloroflexota bacterium]
MNRRQFLRRGLALASLGLVSGCGQISLPFQPPAKRVARVGYHSPAPIGTQTTDVLLDALRGYGYVTGENLVFEPRFGPDEAAMAQELVALQMDVVVAQGLSALQAVHDRAPTMPLVTLAGSDPVQAGLAESMARPGGSLTGLTAISHQLSGKRLALLKESVPGIQRVAVLWNPETPSKIFEFRETEQAAQSLGLKIAALEIRQPDAVERAFAEAKAAGCDALVGFQDQLLIRIRGEISQLALRHGYPTMFEFEAWTRAGVLMSYGPNQAAMTKRAAFFVDRIIKGQKPGDIPIEGPTVFDFVINLKSANALGITIPQSVLAQATEVIQ